MSRSFVVIVISSSSSHHQYHQIINIIKSAPFHRRWKNGEKSSSSSVSIATLERRSRVNQAHDRQVSPSECHGVCCRSLSCAPRASRSLPISDRAYWFSNPPPRLERWFASIHHFSASSYTTGKMCAVVITPPPSGARTCATKLLVGPFIIFP